MTVVPGVDFDLSDPAIRLITADWMEDHGDPRAQYLRVRDLWWVNHLELHATAVAAGGLKAIRPEIDCTSLFGVTSIRPLSLIQDIRLPQSGCRRMALDLMETLEISRMDARLHGELRTKIAIKRMLYEQQRQFSENHYRRIVVVVADHAMFRCYLDRVQNKLECWDWPTRNPKLAKGKKS